MILQGSISYLGNPHGKQRWCEIEVSGTEVYIRYTKRPKVIEDYFESAKVVDVHNHARQAAASFIRNCLEYSAMGPQSAVNLAGNNRD